MAGLRIPAGIGIEREVGCPGGLGFDAGICRVAQAVIDADNPKARSHLLGAVGIAHVGSGGIRRVLAACQGRRNDACANGEGTACSHKERSLHENLLWPEDGRTHRMWTEIIPKWGGNLRDRFFTIQRGRRSRLCGLTGRGSGVFVVVGRF